MPNFKRLIRKINLYPPYLGAGIRVESFNSSFTQFIVAMRLTWYNRNLFGTHFGGSLYSMCDPFFVFILTTNLGKGYVVWDKSARIEFLKPGKGTVRAIFEISPVEIERIREEIDEIGKNTYWFQAEVHDEKGIRIARVEKEIYVRKKQPKNQAVPA